MCSRTSSFCALLRDLGSKSSSWASAFLVERLLFGGVFGLFFGLGRLLLKGGECLDELVVFGLEGFKDGVVVV